MAQKTVYKELPQNGKNGKTNLAHLKDKKGLYKLYENGKLIYIGSSASNLYKTILRHFQTWSDTKQLRRISYKDKLGKYEYTYEVKLMGTSNNDKIALEEYKLVKKHQPRDNKLDLYCGLTGAECQSKLDIAKEKLKKKKKKAKPKPKPKNDLPDDVPF